MLLAREDVCQLLEDKQSLAGADCHVSKVMVTNRHCTPQFAVDAGKLQMGEHMIGVLNGYMYMTAADTCIGLQHGQWNLYAFGFYSIAGKGNL